MLLLFIRPTHSRKLQIKVQKGLSPALLLRFFRAAKTNESKMTDILQTFPLIAENIRLTQPGFAYG